MTSAPPTALHHSPPATGILSRPIHLRGLWAVDEKEHWVRFAQTTLGRVLIFTLAFALAAFLTKRPWWHAGFIVTSAMAFALLKPYRTPILFSATLAVGLFAAFTQQNGLLSYIQLVMGQEHLAAGNAWYFASGALLLFGLFAVTGMELAHRRKTLIWARRPVVSLLVLETLLVVLTSSGWLHGYARVALWSFLMVLTPYLWYLAYALQDQRSPNASPHLFQLGVFRPFWGSSSIPMGKGAAFLRKALAKNDTELAVTQIKAIKLMIWATVLLAVLKGLRYLLDDWLALPTLELAERAFLDHHPYPRALAWAALLWSWLDWCLRVTVWGHLAIAVARVAGFRLPRNIWRPLESRTLVDYFNRFSYYFKELLVDFFFIPTFFRVFKAHPRLRVFFATFMAAGVGNAIFHFVREIDLVASTGLSAALASYTSYIFYCVVLATGIGVSQVRVNAGYRPSPTLAGRVFSFILVWGFVLNLHVFSDESRDLTFIQRLSFMGNLWGIN